MDGHKDIVKLSMFGSEDKMGFHVYSEDKSIHDEIYTFSSKYYDELKKEVAKRVLNPRRRSGRPPLFVVVDNTRKNS